MINVLPFFFPNAGSENGSTQLKTYSLTTSGEKKRRIIGKWPSLSVTD